MAKCRAYDKTDDRKSVGANHHGRDHGFIQSKKRRPSRICIASMHACDVVCPHQMAKYEDYYLFITLAHKTSWIVFVFFSPAIDTDPEGCV